jgi:phosphatidylglycerophosphatase A
MNFRDRTVVFLATGLGAGDIPFAPGTFGTLLGLPICLALDGLSTPTALLAVCLLVLPAVWIAGRAERLLGRKDSPRIVIDEAAGMVVALAGLPAHLPNLMAGFFLFRLLDILKPYPARVCDERVQGGWGVVLDDVVAGAYTNIGLRLAAFLLA